MSRVVIDVARLVNRSRDELDASEHTDCILLSRDQSEFLLRLITDNDEYLELSALVDALKEALK